jgi:hypothetical protein
MELINQLKAIVEAAEADAIKFYEKSNKAAGTRVRKAMQDIKKIAHEVRQDVSARNKAE